jgi:hypothetical protein
MAWHFEALACVGHLSALHLEDRKVLVEVVADIQIPTIRREADRLW